MTLLLEIDVASGFNTKCGDCPCSVWDNFEQTNLCNILEKECNGALTSRPDFCPLKDSEIIPSLH